MLSPSTIAAEKQNKPSLIVKDLAPLVATLADSPGGAEDRVYEVLLRRGVFKWMAVRRDLIRLKDFLKEDITTSIAFQHELQNKRREVRQFDPTNHRKRRRLALKIAEERGYRKGIEFARALIRSLCRSPRWQAPDNDRGAQQFLARRSGDSPVVATVELS